MKYLDGLSEEVVAELNIPTAVPLVYELDDDLKPIKQKDAISPLSGRYLGNQEEIAARILGVKVRSPFTYALSIYLFNSSPLHATRTEPDQVRIKKYGFELYKQQRGTFER